MANYPVIDYIVCKNPQQEYRMYYAAWGNPVVAQKTIICIPGFTSTGRNFDYIANHFVTHGYYVVAVDLVGRGLSDHLQDATYYDIPYYVNDILQLMNTLGNNREFTLLGESLGGIVSMMFAAQHLTLVHKLVLIDAAAELELSGLNSIKQLLSFIPLTFNDLSSATNMLSHSASQRFGKLTDEYCLHLMIQLLHKKSDGTYVAKYDPQIVKNALNVENYTVNPQKWNEWAKIKVPTFVIHGQNSDLVHEDTLRKMQSTNPNMQYINIPNTGHSPALYTLQHMQILENFLL